MKTLIGVLLIINAIAWSATLYEEVQIHRLVGVEATVIESKPMEPYTYSSRGTISITERIGLSVKYKVNDQEKIINITADSVDGYGRPQLDLFRYYTSGRQIMLWINPNNPEEYRLHALNRRLILSSIFLSIFIITLAIYYAGARNE